MIEIVNLRHEQPSEPYDFFCDRRSPIGNPFPMKSEKDRDKVCALYEDFFNNMVLLEDVQFLGYLLTIKKALEIYGRVRLFCWCAPKRCHTETVKRWLEND